MWSEVVNEITSPAGIAIGTLAAGAITMGIHRYLKLRQDRKDYAEADEIMKRAPKIKRIHIPDYSDDPH